MKTDAGSNTVTLTVYTKYFILSAISEILNAGIYVNIFEGNFNDFIGVYPIKFDIVYLDFTNSLLSKNSSPLIQLNSLFDSNVLTDLSIVTINTCYPDESSENIEFLSRFYHYKSNIHRSIYGEEDGSRFRHSFDVYGFFDKTAAENQIQNHFLNAYSDFSTAVPDLFSNIIYPLSRIMRLPTLNMKFFHKEKLKTALDRFSRVDVENLGNAMGFDLVMSASNYGYWHFAEQIILEGKKPLAHFFANPIKNTNFSPFDAIKLYSLIYSIEEGYFDAFSEQLLKTTFQMQTFTFEKRLGGGTIFCDMPMIHLWYFLLIGKYGYPLHINYNNHKRAEYKAKERTMCTDIFTFDRCRSLYDWIPSLEFIGDFFKNHHLQLIIRSYMDKIYKTQFFYNNSFYSWGHLMARNETENAFLTEINDRVIIK